MSETERETYEPNTPWKVDRSPDDNDAFHDFYPAILDADGNLVADTGEGYAVNAAYIVKVVNAHEGLENACRAVLISYLGGLLSDEGVTRRLADQLRAALDKCE